MARTLGLESIVFSDKLAVLFAEPQLTEVILAIHNATDATPIYKVRTSFESMKPMPWALS